MPSCAGLNGSSIPGGERESPAATVWINMMQGEVRRMCPSRMPSRENGLAVVMVVGVLATGCSPQPAAPIDCPSEFSVIERDPGGWDNVWFCSSGTALAASLYEPTEDPVAGVVFVHGSGEVSRLGHENPVVTGLTDGGVAVLTYDKRGVGQSEGECCPGDDGEFTDLIADAAAGIHTLRQLTGQNGVPIGIYGESQAAWIAPSASHAAAADFLILASAPPISFGEEILHEELTDQGIDQERIRQRLGDTQPTGADPRPDLTDLTIPTL